MSSSLISSANSTFIVASSLSNELCVYSSKSGRSFFLFLYNKNKMVAAMAETIIPIIICTIHSPLLYTYRMDYQIKTALSHISLFSD